MTESASFTYDLQRHLVTSSNQANGSGSIDRQYVYDRWGNRTQVYDKVSSGSLIQSVSLVQSSGIPTNQIASVTQGSTYTYTYDGNGNLTNDGMHSYTYDAENRLVKVDSGSTAQYWYDQQNRRIKTTVGSTSTHYIWTGGQVVAEHNAANGNRLIDYIYAGGKLIAKDAGETPKFLLQDKLSIRATVTFDRSGAGYYGYSFSSRQGHLPYGEELGNSGTVDKHKFTSYERDAETATDYAVNRQYHNGTGRFNRVDPASSSYSLANPQSLNRFTYVENEPINNTDGLGLYTDSEDCVWEWDGEQWECVDGGGEDDPFGDDTGNGGSSGSPPGGGGGSSNSVTAPLNSFFTTHPNCAAVFANTPIAAGLPSYKALLEVMAMNTTLIDLSRRVNAGYLNQTLGQLNINPADPGHGATSATRLNVILGNRGNEWGFYDTNNRRIFLSTDNARFPGGSSALIFHEMLHTISNSHTGVANAFNIPLLKRRPGESDDSLADRSLRAWVDSDCGGKKKKKKSMHVFSAGY